LKEKAEKPFEVSEQTEISISVWTNEKSPNLNDKNTQKMQTKNHIIIILRQKIT